MYYCRHKPQAVKLFTSYTEYLVLSGNKTKHNISEMEAVIKLCARSFNMVTLWVYSLGQRNLPDACARCHTAEFRPVLLHLKRCLP